MQAASDQRTELSALATRHISDALELSGRLQAHIAAAQESLLNVSANNRAYIEEIGVIFAFLNSSAALIELIATRLSAISRAFNSPFVIASASDAPARIASAEDQP